MWYMFPGTASIDRDGAVVGLYLDAYVTDRAAPLGMPQKITRYLVPLRHHIPFVSKAISPANCRQLKPVAEPEITEPSLNDWSVSIAEQSFEHSPSIADGFEAIREDLRLICQGSVMLEHFLEFVRQNPGFRSSPRSLTPWRSVGCRDLHQPWPSLSSMWSLSCFQSSISE